MTLNKILRLFYNLSMVQAHTPSLIVITGPMMAAKTTRLLLHVERFKHQNKRVVAFKPKIDVRYSESEIVTHSGWKYAAQQIETGGDIIKFLSESEVTYQAIAIDEMFMIPGVAQSLIWLYQKGLTVVVSTLDLSSLCKPFEEVVKILPWATQIEKCTAVCTVCGQDALYTYKKLDDGETPGSGTQILIGGSETYEPRCRAHHPFFENLVK